MNPDDFSKSLQMVAESNRSCLFDPGGWSGAGCIARSGRLDRARSRLYQSQNLQVNTRWKALAEIYTMHSFAPFSNLNFLVKLLRNFGKKSAKNSAVFNENFEVRERCKGVHCVDLGESFPTSIYLQILASIQPRTSPNKFVSSSSRKFEFEL